MAQVTAPGEAAAGAKVSPAVGIEPDLLREFCEDRELLQRLQVSPQELEALAQTSLLGSIGSKQDVLFMLRTIRSCLSPHSEDTTAAVYSEMAEDIRRSAAHNLSQSEPRPGIVRLRRWSRFALRAGGLALAAIVLYRIRFAAIAAIPRINRFGVVVFGSEALISCAIFLYLHNLVGKLRALRTAKR